MHIIYAQTEIIQLSQEKYHKYVELSQDNVHYPIITWKYHEYVGNTTL